MSSIMAKFCVAALVAVLSTLTFSHGAEVVEDFLSPDECNELLSGPIAELYEENEETGPMVFYDFDAHGETNLHERLGETMTVLSASPTCDVDEIVDIPSDSPLHVSAVLSTVSIRNDELNNDDGCPHVAFVCLEDNEDAYLVDGDEVFAVKQGNLLVAKSVDAIVDDHSNNPIHLLGPFAINTPVSGRRELWGYSWYKSGGGRSKGKGKGGSSRRRSKGGSSRRRSKGGGGRGKSKGGGGRGKSKGGSSRGSRGKSKGKGGKGGKKGCWWC